MGQHINIEFKAKCHNPEAVRQYLQQQGARFVGTDRQKDTYFHCSSGRLKLRQGNIEQALIFSARPNQAGPKQADVNLVPLQESDALHSLLVRALGVWKVVEKCREIYFIDEVKFHLDELQGLGSFLEIEAIDTTGHLGVPHLQQQCLLHMQALGVDSHDLIAGSYSDMV